MPPIENMIFELVGLSFGFVVLMRLWKDPNKFYFMSFLFAVAMTTLIELAGVRIEHSYYYAEFIFEIPATPNLVGMGGAADDSAAKFPIFIAVQWAVIIYSLNLMMERLNIKWYLAPFVCGLVAVSIDMALDPIAASSKMISTIGDSCFDSTIPGIAEGIGYWTWCIPQGVENAQFFGVPLQNFYAWFLVVAIWVFFQSIAYKASYQGTRYAQFCALMTSTILALLVFFTVLQNAMALGASFAWIIWGSLMFMGLGVLVSAGIERTAYTMNWWAYTVLLASSLFCILGLLLNLRDTASSSLVVSTAFWVVFGLAIGAWILLGKRLLGKRGVKGTATT